MREAVRKDTVLPMKAKRNMYDSVFTSLFSDPENMLRLYRDLHPEDTDVTADDIKDVTLKATMVNHIYNDLGFTVGDRSIRCIYYQRIAGPESTFLVFPLCQYRLNLCHQFLLFRNHICISRNKDVVGKSSQRILCAYIILVST